MWTKVSSSNVVQYVQGSDINFYLYGDNQNVVFQLDANNSCGVLTKQFKWVSSGGSSCLNYKISPNPASTLLQVVVPRSI